MRTVPCSPRRRCVWLCQRRRAAALCKGHRHIPGFGPYGMRRSASYRQGGYSGDKHTDGESPLPSFLFCVLDFWQPEPGAHVLRKRNPAMLTFPARWGWRSITTFRRDIQTTHEGKIRKTGGLQAFLGPRGAWVRRSLGGFKTKKGGPHLLSRR